jgi:integrase
MPSIATEAQLDAHNTKSSARKSAQRRTHKRPPRLQADQLPAIFGAVHKRYHPALALAIFAGLRPESEIPNILWSYYDNGNFYGIDFKSKTIHLHDTWCTKTFMERTLHDLPAPLWKILEKHSAETGPISSCNYRNWRTMVVTPIKEALKMDELPHDIFRHTALSFMNTLSGQAVTMNNAGHTSPKVFYQRYNNAVGKAEADLFNAFRIKQTDEEIKAELKEAIEKGTKAWAGVDLEAFNQGEIK